jgi:protease stability complex PrcB-like protein
VRLTVTLRVGALVAGGAVVLAIAGGVVWTQVVEDGSRRLAWDDVTAEMGPVLWPKSVSRSFWRRRQVVRYLARTFPAGPPRVPAFDFAKRRLILVAAGPRSSSGYGVQIVRITERRSTIDVLAREVTPSLGSRTVPELTSPYRLIAVPATSKRVYVQWAGRP